MEVKKKCEEAAKYRVSFYDKIKAGWTSQSLEDTKMVHWLYRIFYMAPSDQDVQVFEWHNFYDVYHDFPMRIHIDNKEDHTKCASMADIMNWFNKPEKDRNALRRMGKSPQKIYCLGCKTEEEKEFLSLMALKKMETKKESPAPSSPSIQPISVKAAHKLGMNTLEMADASLSCTNQPSQQVQNKLLTSVIGLPLRRSASALLFPVSDLLEQHCVKESESVISDLSKCEKSASFSNLNAAPKTAVPSIVTGDKPKAQNPDGPVRKNGTVDTPILKQSEAHKRSIAKRRKHEKLLKASEWGRITNEDKATLVEIKIRQRLLLIQHYIRGWESMGVKDNCIAKWLYDDLNAPLHTRRFASFEYHHFIPSHVIQFPANCEQNSSSIQKTYLSGQRTNGEFRGTFGDVLVQPEVKLISKSCLISPTEKWVSENKN
uniref:Ovule protein n=1 Tax=Caenorhabditis tropicalis TaxID=1561998 RepID=A0A1I7URM8_9PELO